MIRIYVHYLTQTWTPKSNEKERDMKIEGYYPDLGVPSLFIMIIIIKYFISYYETVQEETWYETHTDRQTDIFPSGVVIYLMYIRFECIFTLNFISIFTITIIKVYL